MAPVTLDGRVRFLMCILHTRPRVQRAPGFPCALYFPGGWKMTQTSGALRRENANCCQLDAKSCHTLARRRPRRRAIQYSRDVNDKTERPRRTGCPAFAGHDIAVWAARRVATPPKPPRAARPAVQKSDRRIGADPGADRRESDIDPVFGVADYG